MVYYLLQYDESLSSFNILLLFIFPGFINMNGTLNLVRFEKFLSALSMREMDRFDDIYSDNKWLEGKTAKKKPKGKFNGKGGASAFETVITDTPGNNIMFLDFT